MSNDVETWMIETVDEAIPAGVLPPIEVSAIAIAETSANASTV